MERALTVLQVTASASVKFASIIVSSCLQSGLLDGYESDAVIAGRKILSPIVRANLVAALTLSLFAHQSNFGSSTTSVLRRGFFPTPRKNELIPSQSHRKRNLLFLALQGGNR